MAKLEPAAVNEMLNKVSAAIEEISPRLEAARQAWSDAGTTYWEIESRHNILTTLRADLVKVAESIEYPQTGAPTT